MTFHKPQLYRRLKTGDHHNSTVITTFRMSIRKIRPLTLTQVKRGRIRWTALKTLVPHTVPIRCDPTKPVDVFVVVFSSKDNCFAENSKTSYGRLIKPLRTNGMKR